MRARDGRQCSAVSRGAPGRAGPRRPFSAFRSRSGAASGRPSPRHRSPGRNGPIPAGRFARSSRRRSGPWSAHRGWPETRPRADANSQSVASPVPRQGRRGACRTRGRQPCASSTLAQRGRRHARPLAGRRRQRRLTGTPRWPVGVRRPIWGQRVLRIPGAVPAVRSLAAGRDGSIVGAVGDGLKDASRVRRTPADHPPPMPGPSQAAVHGPRGAPGRGGLLATSNAEGQPWRSGRY